MGERFQLKMESDDLNKGIKDFLLQVMEKNQIKNIIIPLLVPSKKNVFPALVKKKEMLENAKPIAPVLPVSTATMISRITKLSPSPEKIIAFLKPCELRATLELAKFKQIILDNVILISYDCMGAYETDYYEDSLSKGDDIDSKYFSENLLKGKKDDNIRDACQVCEDFYPTDFADIGIGFIGTNGAVLIEANTNKGKELLDNLGLDSFDAKDRDEKLEEISKNRMREWSDKKGEIKKSVTGIDNLSNYFANCINCHNCMGQCPICFCKECFWESPTFEFSPLNFLGWAERKGAVKLPTDTLFFHLGRLTHMSTSCISCGLCSDACPKDIKVHEVFHLVGDDTQAAFDYKPGRDLEEEAPLVTFLEEELQELG
jgi:formate dehydrogenase subunit beta